MVACSIILCTYLVLADMLTSRCKRRADKRRRKPERADKPPARRRAEMLIFPKRMRVAHLAQGLPDLQHCRVRRQHVECLAWRGRRECRLYGLLAVGDDGAYRELGVLEAHGHVFGPDAADGEQGGIRFALLSRVVRLPSPCPLASPPSSPPPSRVLAFPAFSCVFFFFLRFSFRFLFLCFF